MSPKFSLIRTSLRESYKIFIKRLAKLNNVSSYT